MLPAGAGAAPLTVTWDVVPHEDGELEATPFYYCTGASWAGRRCSYLWEQGLELHGVAGEFFFDDKWFDGYGYGDTSIGNGVMGMRPRCEPALAPCFDRFTPSQLRLSGHSIEGPRPNLFVVSSRGGMVKLPSVDGLEVINFRGSKWRNITSLEVGFYLPAVCEKTPPPDDERCLTSTEKAFVVESLTFEPFVETVPEPALTVLLATGVAGLVRRRLGRRSTYR